MRAVRFHGNQDLRVDEVPVAPVGPDQVKIAPEWCGLCGSGIADVEKGWRRFAWVPWRSSLFTCWSSSNYQGRSSKDIRSWICRYSFYKSIDLNFIGKVLEVGKNVTDLQPGDKVSVYPLLYDGTCSRCQAGHPNICENLGFYGISGWGGGLSEAVSVDRKKVYKLPPNMTTELGGKNIQSED